MTVMTLEPKTWTNNQYHRNQRFCSSTKISGWVFNTPRSYFTLSE